jgi:deoxyribose-phosphate aldolase
MTGWDPTIDAHALAARIDHTLLRADATDVQVRGLATEARSFGTAGACAAPSYVPLLAEVLAGTAVKVVTVVGFPLGFSSRTVKAFETAEAVRRGADEIDVVAHLGLLKAGRWDAFQADLKDVVQAAEGRAVKAILETALLTPEEVRRAAEAAERAGVAFVKTSTGFGPGGATVEVVMLLRRVLGERVRIKASGGIRTLAQARALLAAGADRLGTAATAAILEEARGAGAS